MRRAAFALLLALLPLAGCAGTAPEAPTPGPATPAIVEERPETAFGEVEAGPAAPPDADATLLAPPALVPGEWWRIRFESPYTEATEFYRVVARVEPDGTALVGMPHEGWWKEAVIFHTPALGEVAPDQSYAAHDVPFRPLQFPLTADATWETAWESEEAKLVATVEPVDDTTADVVFTGASCPLTSILLGCDDSQPAEAIRLRYDAKLHAITRFEAPGMAWEVLEHGYGFEGWITIPRAEDLVFLHGRLGPLGLDGAPDPSPVDTVEVAGGYNRVSFILGAGGVGPGTGVFRERATAPDGTVYEIETKPGDGPYRAVFLEHPSPDGTWTFEHLAGGGGLVMAEGVAYHQYDIRLPDGAMRTDHAHDVVR